MTLQQLNAESFEKNIYDNAEACLVIFSRQACHVCLAIVPVLEDLQPKYEGQFGFYYVDVEISTGLYKRFSLKGVPQILFFNNGEYQGKLAGEVDEELIESKIVEALKS